MIKLLMRTLPQMKRGNVLSEKNSSNILYHTIQ